MNNQSFLRLGEQRTDQNQHQITLSLHDRWMRSMYATIPLPFIWSGIGQLDLVDQVVKQTAADS